jgi:hypothetical protein
MAEALFLLATRLHRLPRQERVAMDREEGSARPRRGQRFDLHLHVRFRAAGEAEWHEGTTENVSRSGAMIRAGSAPPTDVPVDVLIVLPRSGAQPSGCLVGHGRVVRNIGTDSSTGETAFAVTVGRYRLEPLMRALDTSHEK